VLITATLGEHGTIDPDTWPPERLARLRDGELRGDWWRTEWFRCDTVPALRF
jgi:hypothetical protein